MLAPSLFLGVEILELLELINMPITSESSETPGSSRTPYQLPSLAKGSKSACLMISNTWSSVKNLLKFLTDHLSQATKLANREKSLLFLVSEMQQRIGWRKGH